LLAEILGQHPEEVLDLPVARERQPFGRQGAIDGVARRGVGLEPLVRLRQVQEAGVAHRHQIAAQPLRQRQDAAVRRQVQHLADGAELARSGAARVVELRQLDVEQGGDRMGADVELAARPFGRASGKVGVSPLHSPSSCDR
jgi:hypothetical protein